MNVECLFTMSFILALMSYARKVIIMTSNIQTAILSTLKPMGIGGLTATLAAISLKLKNGFSIVVSPSYLEEQLDALVKAGKIIQVKNSSGKDAFQLTPIQLIEEVTPVSEIKTLESGQLVIGVTQRTKASHDEAIAHYRKEFKTIDMASTIFEMALAFTDYVLEESVTEDLTNGGAYFDPLTSAIFYSSLGGAPLETGATIAMNKVVDGVVIRRLYVIVVKTGVNIILHDRYSIASGSVADFLVVKTAQRGSCNFAAGYNLLTSTNVWGNCFADRIRMADIFGLEVKKEDGTVYPPSQRPAPTFSYKL